MAKRLIGYGCGLGDRSDGFPGMTQIIGFGDRSTGTGNFGGEYEAPRIVTNGDFAATRPLPESP